MKNPYTYIYIDPRTNEPFYVGKGSTNRAYVHTKTYAPLDYVANRVKEITRSGCEPVIEIIEASSHKEACQLEVDLIAQYGRQDLGTGPLLNKSAGGDIGGIGKRSDEVRQRISASNKNKSKSQLQRDRISNSLKNRNADPAVREQMRKSAQKRCQQDGYHEKRVALQATESWKTAHAEGIKRKMSDPAHRERLKEAARIRSENPEWRSAQAERNRVTASNPERNKKISEAKKEYWRKWREERTPTDPKIPRLNKGIVGKINDK